MAVERPDDPEALAGPCRSCGAPTTAAQRYCLSCGALVGTRRIEPLEVLRRQAEGTQESVAVAHVAAGVPASARTRAVPATAAAVAILIAGVSGALIGGDGDGARAAVIAGGAAPAPVAAPPATTAAAPAAKAPTVPDADAAPATAAEEPTVDASAEAPVADEPAPVTDEAPPAGEDTSGAETTPDDPEIPPHVWMLALDGPRAQEAVDRIAEQGVRLTGIAPAGPDAITNATTLVTGALPPAAGVTPDPAAAVPPSLPELLSTADQTWRSYLDVQPGGQPALPGVCADPPAGDAAAATLAGRTPFGRIAALRTDDACAAGTASLETLGNDVSSGESLPSFSYATLGGCAPPERTVVALPDQVSDTVTAITESTEFQENGVVVVTAVGGVDPCPVPGAAPPAAAAAPSTATPAPTPTVVLRANAKPGSTLDVAADLRALTRLTATTLGVDSPGTSGADDVPALELPAADG